MASLDDCKDKEWLQAQAQLWAAQRLPAGKERIEAEGRLVCNGGWPLRSYGKERTLISAKIDF